MQRRALEVQLAAGEPAEAPDPVEDLAALTAIEAPVLVIAGARDMPDFVGGARDIADAIPGARRETIAAAGHLAPLETPGEFRVLLLDFLRSNTP